ncbi:conserved hypothetical protein [uncultured Desulfobacterium sp.]|uniref:Uncharacterized protein n=1 Tax=uncultured Desulfobacterium sp. TaxID=201089 RepID=A0A445N1P0_9BACT|nr:conserved hypothetical protein [uncultured Desulfobacterium sp.]
MAFENDVVLIYFEDQPATFARIESIDPDIKRDWYHVTLLLLTIPVQTVTWILRRAYINGTPFTMNGKSVRLEKVEKVDSKFETKAQLNPSEKEKIKNGNGTIIPFRKIESKNKDM